MSDQPTPQDRKQPFIRRPVRSPYPEPTRVIKVKSMGGGQLPVRMPHRYFVGYRVGEEPKTNEVIPAASAYVRGMLTRMVDTDKGTKTECPWHVTDIPNAINREAFFEGYNFGEVVGEPGHTTMSN